MYIYESYIYNLMYVIITYTLFIYIRIVCTIIVYYSINILCNTNNILLYIYITYTVL